MHGDPGILCFQHCERDVKIFCFDVPKVCPLCRKDLLNAELRIPPFRIPYPFSGAKKMPCSVVIKPTSGDFLHNYQNSADLHIGVTDSKGDVHEFDKEGLCRGRVSEWSQCLPIPVCPKLDGTWKEYWDYILDIVCTQESWDKDRYNEENHNCYTFVIYFLRTLQLKDLKPSLMSKTQFCKDFIIPRTRNAAKYIALYRQLRKEGVSIQR